MKIIITIHDLLLLDGPIGGSNEVPPCELLNCFKNGQILIYSTF